MSLRALRFSPLQFLLKVGLSANTKERNGKHVSTIKSKSSKSEENGLPSPEFEKGQIFLGGNMARQVQSKYQVSAARLETKVGGE